MRVRCRNRLCDGDEVVSMRPRAQTLAFDYERGIVVSVPAPPGEVVCETRDSDSGCTLRNVLLEYPRDFYLDRVLLLR